MFEVIKKDFNKKRNDKYYKQKYYTFGKGFFKR